MKPLKEIPLDNIDNLHYSSKRCSALFYFLSAKFRPVRPEGADEILKKADLLNRTAASSCFAIAERNGQQEGCHVKGIVDDTERFMELYRTSMDNSYMNEGVQVNQFIMDDSNICNIIIDFVSTYNSQN